jgi:hypothetical protein
MSKGLYERLRSNSEYMGLSSRLSVIHSSISFLRAAMCACGQPRWYGIGPCSSCGQYLPIGTEVEAIEQAMREIAQKEQEASNE